MNCEGPPPPEGSENNNCYPVKKYIKFRVSQYGSVSTANKMKAEIFARGPISCGIAATDKFVKYKGGIYEENASGINHVIEVVGFGKENGIEYWVGRNSWGTYWGESGFFRIRMHKNNL